jgi:hypothetical protein
VRLDHGLHAVSDQFARRQAEFHPGMSHGNAIVHADGVELERYSARFAHSLLNTLPEILQVNVPGDDIHVRVDDGDEGFAEVLILHPGGFQKRPVGCPLKSFLDRFRAHTGPLLLSKKEVQIFCVISAEPYSAEIIQIK